MVLKKEDENAKNKQADGQTDNRHSEKSTLSELKYVGNQSWMVICQYFNNIMELENQLIKIKLSQVADITISTQALQNITHIFLWEEDI